MEKKKMNPVDRINLVAMQQDRKLHEKRCEVRELEKVKKELEKTLNDFKKANEAKQRKLDKKREHNQKMRNINERFKKNIKLINDHNELLQERNIIAEENCTKELARYEDLVKTCEQKEKEHLQVYEQFPYVQEQKQWSEKLENLKMQVSIEEKRVEDQKEMNTTIHSIQQCRLNNSIVQFVAHVVALWKQQNEIEQAQNSKQVLVVRLNSLKEKILIRQSRSMQLEFQVPQSFLEQVGHVSNAITYSSTSSLKKLESNLMHTLSKFTGNISKATDPIPCSQISPLQKRVPENYQTIQKTNDSIKKLNQMTLNIRSSQEKISPTNSQQQVLKASNKIAMQKVLSSNQQLEASASLISTTCQISLNQTPSIHQRSNLINENKQSTLIKRKRENSETNIKVSTSISRSIGNNQQQKEALPLNNIVKETSFIEPKEQVLEQNTKIIPIKKKVRINQDLPKILNIEIIEPSVNLNTDDVISVHETSEMKISSGIGNQSISFSSDETVQGSTQNSQNIIQNYDVDIAAARSHMSSILERSPEYPAFNMAGDFVSPRGISSPESEVNEVNEVIMNPPQPSISSEKTTTFSIFRRNASEKKDNTNFFFGTSFY